MDDRGLFFKEAKQLLGLGKCQSTNFDVQVAQTTITMVRYLLISLRHRMEAYQTIGGIFKNLKQDYLEHKLNKRLLLAPSPRGGYFGGFGFTDRRYRYQFSCKKTNISQRIPIVFKQFTKFSKQ